MEEAKNPQETAEPCCPLTVEALRYLIDVATRSLESAQISIASNLFSESQVVENQLTLIGNEIQSLLSFQKKHQEPKPVQEPPLLIEDD